MPDTDQFELSYEQWTEQVRPFMEGVTEILPPTEPMPPVSVEEVRLALVAGPPDGTRFERREQGWIIADGERFYLADTPDPVWSSSGDEEDDPPVC